MHLPCYLLSLILIFWILLTFFFFFKIPSAAIKLDSIVTLRSQDVFLTGGY